MLSFQVSDQLTDAQLLIRFQLKFRRRPISRVLLAQRLLCYCWWRTLLTVTVICWEKTVLELKWQSDLWDSCSTVQTARRRLDVDLWVFGLYISRTTGAASDRRLDDKQPAADEPANWEWNYRSTNTKTIKLSNYKTTEPLELEFWSLYCNTAGDGSDCRFLSQVRTGHVSTGSSQDFQ